MRINRGQLREIFMQCIFQIEAQKAEDIVFLEKFISEKKIESEDELILKENLNRLILNLQEIDCWINKFSDKYNTSRMDKISLAVLRLAVYEFIFDKNLPVGVSANEAVRISKKYSTLQYSQFVNGLIGNLLRDKEFEKLLDKKEI